MSDPTTTPQGRGRFTLSIVLMIVPVLMTAVLVGWIAHRARAQRKAVAEIRRLHGMFNYDWRVRAGRNVGKAPPGPKWLRNLIGDEPFQEVNAVILAKGQTRNQTVTEATLAYIGELKALKELHLDGAAVTDAGLAHLRGLTSLEKLSLGDTSITDAGLANLRGLKALKELYLYRTKLTDAGLAYLKGLDRLQVLILESTPITDAGLANLV
jgi:Leucine rich repeat